jgi:cholera toxin transcriptional activator
MLHYGVVPLPQNTSRVVRFGVFEVDVNAGELRKNGMKLRLQGQPFQVLALLLEHQGEIVTREELQRKLWPSDTFVDFDHSLNTAINKVREALGDSASNPRYVETVARKGYRFIAPLQPERQTHQAMPASANAVPEPAQETARLHPELDVPIPRRGVTRGLFGLIQVMYLSFYVAALVRLRAVEAIADSFLPPRAAIGLVIAVMVTAGVGIPLRCYLLSSAAFDYRRLAQKFRQMFVFILALDQLWAVAPFLLASHIGLGAAFAACAALLYVPFSERTLIRMAYHTLPG